VGQRVVALKKQVAREMQEVQRYLEEVAAANQRWEQAAFTDALTGLPNRRYAMERLEQEWSSAVRNDRPLSCMLVDIDLFKRVNDTHGHAVGDLVLKSVSNVLRASIRTEDIVCRVGGEEFLVICVETSKEEAGSSAAERLRKAVANHIITTGTGFNGRVTISVGVAERDRKNDTVDALIKSADSAVYAAKQAGRNRVSLAA
jgi:diguanylate cyclase (GGDEF)-like protein